MSLAFDGLSFRCVKFKRTSSRGRAVLRCAHFVKSNRKKGEIHPSCPRGTMRLKGGGRSNGLIRTHVCVKIRKTRRHKRARVHLRARRFHRRTHRRTARRARRTFTGRRMRRNSKGRFVSSRRSARRTRRTRRSRRGARRSHASYVRAAKKGARTRRRHSVASHYRRHARGGVRTWVRPAYISNAAWKRMNSPA